MKISFLLLSAFVFSSTVFASDPEPRDPKFFGVERSISSNGYELINHQVESSGASEGRQLIDVNDRSLRSISKSSSDCSSWYINGYHSWKGRYYVVYIRNEIYGKTETFYGSPSNADSCDRRPLTVDRIRVHGHTNQAWDNSRVSIDKTAYNTHIVEAKRDKKMYVSGAAAQGATVTHIAEKNGIEWSVVTTSGDQ